MSAKWTKGSDDFMWWSVGVDGPCSPTTGICKVKPLEKAGDTRFNIHQIILGSEAECCESKAYDNLTTINPN